MQGSLFNWADEPEPWQAAADSDRLVAEIVFNRPLENTFHYEVPDPLRELITPGQRVVVPFGHGDARTMGYCVGLSTDAPVNRRLKRILEICDAEPLLSGPMLQLTKWIGERYLCSWGQVLEAVIPAGVKKQAGTREITAYEMAVGVDPTTLRLTAKQRQIVAALEQSSVPLSAAVLTELVKCGTSPIKSLEKKGILIPCRRRSELEVAEEATVARQDDLILNQEQQDCLNTILRLVRNREHQTVLMQGVTGSGKTEVYIQAIREIVSYGQQAIVLVPEISLTPQTIRRFRARFDSVAVLHSHLSDVDRHWHWQQIAQGRIQVVVGARSAVFAPTPNLGLIVIDEEHETTFKQQTTPRYHAREVARERARQAGVPLILGSATPTLESLLSAQQGGMILKKLQHRVESRPLPPVTLVDVRNDPFVAKRHSIGRALGQAVQRALNDQGQVILFLNLRGYSPVLWCPKCQGIRCPDCDVTLTWHRDREVLLCHSCDFEMAPPERCPRCDQPGLRYLGTGTQRLEAEIKNKFPDARVVRMDSDSMQKAGSHDRVLEKFRIGEIDILLGTQMIAKGLDFPNVTLVGVIDADTLLHQPDMRAAERTFQLIAQVAGRTGRGEREGRVLVQTMSPDEPVIQFAIRHDYEGFARYELANRQAMQAPPFTAMARLILRSLDDAKAQSEIRRVAEILRNSPAKEPGVRILGPAPAPLTRLRKYYRYHIQLTAPSIDALRSLWNANYPLLKLDADVELTIDVDPLDLR